MPFREREPYFICLDCLQKPKQFFTYFTRRRRLLSIRSSIKINFLLSSVEVARFKAGVVDIGGWNGTCCSNGRLPAVTARANETFLFAHFFLSLSLFFSAGVTKKFYFIFSIFQPQVKRNFVRRSIRLRKGNPICPGRRRRRRPTWNTGLSLRTTYWSEMTASPRP